MDIKFPRHIDYFLNYNYEYFFMKSRYKYIRNSKNTNMVLVTGSSHSLYGINGYAWNDLVNCSMFSQDIYYDFVCGKCAVESSVGRFDRCIIIMGYYMAFQDLSKAKQGGHKIISKVYYPLFNDARNWKEPCKYEKWYKYYNDYGATQEDGLEATICNQIMNNRNYFKDRLGKRGSYFDFGGREWGDISLEERDSYGIERAEQHNKHLKHIDCLEDNKHILADYVHLLRINNIHPILVVTPFSKEYCKYVDKSMIDGFHEMLAYIKEDYEFKDMNDDSNQYDCRDFVDTDHLSKKGSEKVSKELVNCYGK